MKRLFIFISSLTLFFSFALPSFAAITPIPDEGIMFRNIENSTCVYSDKKRPEIGQVMTFDCLPVLFMNLVYWALVFAGVVALFLIIIGGIKFITSGGDPKQLEGARKVIIWAVIGLVVIIMSFAIVRLVANLTGIDCITRIGFDVCSKNP